MNKNVNSIRIENNNYINFYKEILLFYLFN